MEAVLSVIQNIMDMGASVMLPVVIFILSCVFRMKIGKALKTGLLVGIGFQGLGLVVGLLGTSLQPAIDYYQEMGSGYTTMDVGWAAVGAASWSVPFAAIAILMIVGLNVLFILLKWTTVMNVDIWNYIHFLIPGALAYALFDSFWLGLTVTVGLSIVTLFVAQWFAPRWEAYYGLEGTTCTTFSFITFAYPFGLLVNKLIDLIPGLNKIDISLEKVESKIGFFGDPAVIGLLVGTFLGVLTRQEFTVAISMGGWSFSSTSTDTQNGFCYDGRLDSDRGSSQRIYEETYWRREKIIYRHGHCSWSWRSDSDHNDSDSDSDSNILSIYYPWYALFSSWCFNSNRIYDSTTSISIKWQSFSNACHWLFLLSYRSNWNKHLCT